MNTNIKSLIIFFSMLTLTACEKFVDIEPKGQLIPSALTDFRMLLDEVQKMNFTGSIGELSSDNMYYNDIDFQNLSNTFEKNTYTWNKSIYLPSDQATDWNTPYERIYTTNVILEGLEKTNEGSMVERNTVKGEALFHRSIALYEVVTLYAGIYNESTANDEKGVPIRTSSDVFAVSERPTLKETYEQVLNDCEEAANFLPARAEIKTRASKSAAYALLARVYMDMELYDKALENALNVLEIQDDLLDYNDIDVFASPRFPELNAEVIMHFTLPNFAYSFDWTVPINQDLYDLYDDNDLRKTLFFDVYDPGSGVESAFFSGSYGGWWPRFTGLANDEIYLVAAECYARQKDYTQALSYLNQLLEKRYVNGTYVPFESTDETEILSKIILERRKELVARNTRWNDLKRYNRDSYFAITLERTVAGQTYTLPPNDPRYVFPIPQTVIAATGMEQNER